nr:immunoglobulin heavy chain junction region [Macaca mulatta]MOV38009.1 immunoglobulin heavy chain junction region [Macaca mulatta]MOV38076.1 immunoglobulin heavy chain junction region [Macaca mulatta]MOV38342.1 immunoglobulin heavy chain junction region [Macaca mulatta]MOV38785.1 immunoglobulin heavy chain junction region [Macaca mulatta]
CARGGSYCTGGVCYPPVYNRFDVW